MFGLERKLLARFNPTRTNEHGVLFGPNDAHAFLRCLDIPRIGFQSELPKSVLCVLPPSYHYIFDALKRHTLARIDCVDEMIGGWIGPGQLIVSGNVTYYSIYQTDDLAPNVVFDRFSTKHGDPYVIRRAHIYAASDVHFPRVEPKERDDKREFYVPDNAS